MIRKSYYVKKPGKLLWGDCYRVNQLRAAVAAGKIHRDWLASTDGNSITITTVGDVLDQAPIDPDPPSTDVEINDTPSRSAFLQSVRQNTCYQTLRLTIAWCAIISMLINFGVAGFYFFHTLKYEGLMSFVIALAIAGIGYLFIIAAKQAALLLVDIADTLIDQNYRK